MLIPNYNPESHFKRTVNKTVRENFHDLIFATLTVNDGMLVRWESNSGFNEHFVPVLEKEELLCLLEKIQSTV